MLYQHFQISDLIAKFGNFHALTLEILSATTDSNVIHSDINDIRPLTRFTDGRSLLIGDAAHAITPNLGQGACQAIEDGVELARCLQKHSGIPRAFHHFEQLRRQRTHQISKRSLAIGKLAQLENPFLCGLRNLMMRVAPTSMQMKQLESLYNVNFND
ncbi:FAD-dependent monooxygenase [Paenibacillus sp. Soil766]|uniref:FAD-dependent monooxygenase n=1 Tax=Paenibacillus sp. Soil766 TaxID=1736404 RepID=UPI000AFE3C92|nr:FAD-dependent monooxygenase [Paenibacillus sp. Soil766]